MNFQDIITQIIQPYFYYSVVFLAISLVCVKLLTKYCPFTGKTRSFLFLFPLALPTIVMLVFAPKTHIVAFEQAWRISASASVYAPVPVAPSSLQNTNPFVYFPDYCALEIPSIMGIICIFGLSLAVLTFLTMFLSGRILIKSLHIIELSLEEYPWLQTRIRELSEELKITPPRMCITENLRPNAFTMGHGRKTMLVFTIGILNVLNEEELTAVAGHELVHIKNHDFFFKTLSCTLTAASFFNPFAHLSCSAAQKERELLADAQGAKLLENPKTLGQALTKISLTFHTLPQERVLTRIASNLLVTSSILSKPHVLATHPSLNQRLKNISLVSKRTTRPNRSLAAFLLSFLIIFAGVATCYAMIGLQSDLTSQTIFHSTEVFSPYGYSPSNYGLNATTTFESQSLLDSEPKP